MGFKDSPRWLKGGLWFFGIGLFIMIMAFLLSFGDNAFINWLQTIFQILLLPLTAIAIVITMILGCSAIYNSCPIQTVLGFVVSLIILFGIGALIGYLIEKRKKL